MTAPEYVAQVAELLREHRWDNETALCQCGLMVGLVCDGLTREQHQAEVLAAAGLIPTSTEWGVRFVGADEPMTYTDEADARLVATDIDADGLVSRAVTDWKDATDG